MGERETESDRKIERGRERGGDGKERHSKRGRQRETEKVMTLRRETYRKTEGIDRGGEKGRR